MSLLNLSLAYPEIFLLTALTILLVLDLFISDAKRVFTYRLALLILAACAWFQYHSWVNVPTLAFNKMYIADPLAGVIKFFIYGVTAAIFIYTRQYASERTLLRGEFYTLSLFALLGMNVLVSANHLLTLYIGVELLSLALYALIALRRDCAFAAEAAMKYFVLGALASGLLLYGMSMIYGATSTLNLTTLNHMLRLGEGNAVLLVLGLVFVVAGLCFKLGVVPFHMWVPDVYQGAPTAIVLLIGAAPKLAAFVFFFRLLAQGLDALIADWQAMLAIVAVLSMALGNLAAIAQTEIKRMLAYSTISHMGFLLLGFLVGSAQGYGAALYYTLVYVLMTLVAFGVILLLSHNGVECEKLSDLKGLNQRHSGYAALMLLAMFSMAGIPPLVGFYAKFVVIRSLLEAQLTLLAVYAVIMALIGAFYYLRIVKLMYFDDAQSDHRLQAHADMRWTLSLNALALLALGLLPEPLLSLCINAIRQSLS